jgi:hypothetical protein
MGPTTCRSSARRPSSSASRSIPCANSAPPRSNPPPESILPASQSLPPSPPVLDDTHASGQLPQVLRHPPTSDDPKKTERPESIPRGSTITPPATRPCTQISPGARGTTAPTATTNPHTTTHLDAGERRAGVHRRPPPVQPCRVLTGPLRPADGSPALPGESVRPRLLRVLRHAPAATADSAPAPNPPTRVRRAPPGRSHVHSYAGRHGRRPAVPRGHRRALPQHRAASPARASTGQARRPSPRTRTKRPNSP